MSIARFYLNDPAAPKPNRPTHLGANVLLEWDGKLLLERRRDCDTWGLPGGGMKPLEQPEQCVARELFEETGIRLQKPSFQKVRVFGDYGRVASFRDGSVWRMVVYLYRATLTEEPKLKKSAESKELRFFSREELKTLNVICTHSDMVALF